MCIGKGREGKGVNSTVDGQAADRAGGGACEQHDYSWPTQGSIRYSDRPYLLRIISRVKYVFFPPPQ